MRSRIIISLVAMALVTCAGVRAADESPSPSPSPSPPAAQATPKEQAKEPSPPPSVTVIGARDAHGILGRDVRSTANEDMGRIVDVIVDRDGQVRAAVIDFGGFLGVGSRKIVVDWKALRFPASATRRQHHP